MHNLVLLQFFLEPLIDGREHFVQIRTGQLFATACLHLHDQDRMHILIMVSPRIVQPVRALRRILSHGSLQHGYRIIFPRILRVDDLDAFF